MPHSIGHESTFTFFSPVKLIFQAGAVDRLGQIVPAARRVLVVTGRGSARKSGLLDRVIGGLGDREVEVFEGVEPNPSIATCQAGAETARQRLSELVIGLGGGSAMDAAKVIAALATNGDFRENFGRERFPVEPLPTVAVPTTCGTGSEANPYAIITDPDAVDKINFSNEQTYPLAGVLDPTVLDSLPTSVLIDTALDAFTHAFEGYTSRHAQPLPDCLAVEAIGLIVENLPPAVEGDRDARANLLWASAIAGLVIGHTRTTVLHVLGYYLTLRHDVPHGRANAMLVPLLLDYLQDKQPEKVARVLSLFPEQGQSLAGVSQWLGDLGVDTRLSSCGLAEDEHDRYVAYTIQKGAPKTTVGDLTPSVLGDLLRRHA